MSISNDQVEKLHDLYQQQQWQDLKKQAADLITSNPNHAELYSLLGSAELALKNNTAGIVSLTKACTLAPQDNDYHLALAEAYLESDQQDQAMLVYTTMLQQDPHDEDALVGSAVILAGNKSYDEAQALLSTARQHHPQSAFVLNAQGDLWGMLGQYSEAQQCYEQAIELAPDDPMAYENLADMLYDLDEIEEAEAVLLEGFENAGPEMTTGHLTMVDICMDQERIAEAIQHLERYIVQETNPQADDLKQEACAILEELKKEGA